MANRFSAGKKGHRNRAQAKSYLWQAIRYFRRCRLCCFNYIQAMVIFLAHQAEADARPGAHAWRWLSRCLSDSVPDASGGPARGRAAANPRARTRTRVGGREQMRATGAQRPGAHARRGRNRCLPRCERLPDARVSGGQPARETAWERICERAR